MNFDQYLPTKLKEFFTNHPIPESLKFIYILILRKDGVIFYSSDEKEAVIDKDTAGALMGGVWQAATALSQIIPTEPVTEKKDKDMFRLSFDTTSAGVYMFPLQICQNEYYLSLFYHNQLNPALLKCKVRELGQNIGKELTYFFSDPSSLTKSKSDLLKANHTKRRTTSSSTNLNSKKVKGKVGVKEQYLFNDLSDAEVDKLFTFVGSETCRS